MNYDYSNTIKDSTRPINHTFKACFFFGIDFLFEAAGFFGGGFLAGAFLGAGIVFCTLAGLGGAGMVTLGDD